jgi:predicted phage terminase large subunit-like protein
VARRVRAWDLAASIGGDETSGLRMCRHENRYYVEDLIHGRWTPHDRDAIIRQTAEIDGHGVEVVIEQEPGSAGLSQIAAMVTLLAGFRVSGKRATGDKVTRAGPLASQCEAGNVKLLSGPWVGAFLDQLSAFPSDGVHDDIVDSASLAFSVLAERTPGLGGIVSQGRAQGNWTGGGRRRF